MNAVMLAAARAEDWTKRLLAKIENSDKARCVIFAALLALIAVSMYMLNMYMPLILDDYDFMVSWSTGKPLAGFTDVIRSQMVHYQIWGGRLMHVFTQSFLYLGKDVFCAANTAMFLVLLLEIYAIARPKRRFCWTLLLTAYLALLSMVPFFGTVFLWLTGACIYLWGTVFALMPLAIARNIGEGGLFSRGRVRAALCFAAGVLAGWTNENTACGMVAAIFVLIAWDYLKSRKLSVRLLLLFAGQCVGTLLLLLAPGNFARASAYTYDSMIIELIKRFVLVTGYGASYLGVLLAAVLFLSAGITDGEHRKGHAYVLVFASLASAYAMVGSPELSDRTFTGPFVLMLTAVLMLLGDVEMRSRRLDAAKIAALPLLLVFTVYTSYHAVSDVRGFGSAWELRAAAIEDAAARGDAQVIIAPIEGHSRFTMDIIMDQDPAQWPNSTISKHYGVGVIGQ